MRGLDPRVILDHVALALWHGFRSTTRESPQVIAAACTLARMLPAAPERDEARRELAYFLQHMTAGEWAALSRQAAIVWDLRERLGRRAGR